MRSYLFAFLFLVGFTYGNTAKAGYDFIVSDIRSSPPYVNFSITNLGSTHFYGYHTLRVYSASTGANRYFNYYVSLAPYSTRGLSFTLSELGAASAASQPTQSFTAYADWDWQVAETNESNNSLTKSVSLATPRPDMIVEDIYVEGTYLKVRTKNIGNQVTYGYPQVGVTANGLTKEQQIYTQIAAGGTNTYAFPLTDFSMVAGQSYAVTATADSYNQMYESNESNNSLPKTVTLAANLPDLVITGIVEEGDNIKFTFKNNGTDINAPFYLDYGSNSHGTGQSFYTILAGEVKDIIVSKSSLGATVDGSTYMFYARADSQGWVTESNENNNYLEVNIRVGAANLPDLIVRNAVIEGSELVLNFDVVANPLGDAVMGIYGNPIRLNFAVSGGSSWSKDYYSLSAGSYTERFALSSFYMNQGSSYNISTQIDGPNWVAEKLENNNLVTQSLCVGTCAPPPPPASVDLQIVSVSRYLNGSSVYALVTYKNAGTATSASKFKIKVEINGLVTTSFSDLSVPAAGASASNYIYLGSSVSSNTLKATVDHANTVVESNEANNIFTKYGF